MTELLSDDRRWPYSDAELSLRSKLKIWAQNLANREAQHDEAERVAEQPKEDDPQ